jgi:predicted TIM-barrel fold metal-dependent hydrolase
MLGEFPNLYGDLSGTSGLNALSRDPDFTASFLARHQDKLMFGSDCFCRDGHGEGQSVPSPLVAGRCIARATLTTLQRVATPEVFRKVVWGNATRLLKLA